MGIRIARQPARVSALSDVTVLVADNEELVRAGPRLIIDGEPSLRVVGEASDGLQVLDLARKRAPDVVLLEIRLPAMDGLTAARRIIDETRCRVLLITILSSDEQVFRASACEIASRPSFSPTSPDW